jgi:GTP cyclohydrolase I
MDKNQELFEQSVTNMIKVLGEDPSREGLQKTPARVYKAFQHFTSGYGKDPKAVLNSALFTTTNDEMVIVKDIEFYSLCEHHLLPIIGKAHIAYIPNGKVTGLSKIPRVVDIFARRFQIQEELTEQIASTINEVLSPIGVGVVIEARHMCMEMRGVEKINSSTTTSSIKGVIRDDPKTREEFFMLIKNR